MKKLISFLAFLICLSLLVNSSVSQSRSSSAVMLAQRRSSIPALPPFVGAETSLCASLWNWNPVGYVEQGLTYIEDAAASFRESSNSIVAPYPIEWANLVDGGYVPPYLFSTWFDQNANTNSLTQSGSARPTLQVTTPAIVVGGSQPGTYTYRGQSDGYGYYNLLGQPTSTTNWCIKRPASAWLMTNGSGDAVTSDEGGNNVSFPWQVPEWGGGESPTVAAGTGSGEVVFDGVQTGLLAPTLYAGGSQTGTIYLAFKAGSLVETSVIVESNRQRNNAETIHQIRIRIVAGVLTVSLYDDTAVVALANTKIKTISDTNWHWMAVTFDTTISAASQVLLKVDDSATGVTAPISTDLGSLAIGTSPLNIGAHDLSGTPSLFFTGSMKHLLAKNVVDSGATQALYYNRWVYLQSLAP